jgi:hypothetical protein
MFGGFDKGSEKSKVQIRTRRSKYLDVPLDTGGILEGVRGMKQAAKSLSLVFCLLMLPSVFSITLTTTVSAQPAVEWVAIYDGPAGGDDHTGQIVLGSSGNVYVTGEGRWNFFNGDDYLTIGYDSFGNELWVARYDGPAGGDDWTFDMATDTSENIYITGFSVGSGTSYDYATISYDSDGNELWVARYDGPASLKDWGTEIALDASGNIYVTGRSHDENEEWDIVTVAYDSSGNELWVARFDSPLGLNDTPNDMAVSPSGNVYVTGRSYDDQEGSDWATIAYDSSGNELWVATYDGPTGGFDEAWALATDSSGNVYVTGESVGSGTGLDYATVAYDSSGNELWVARYDGPASLEDTAYGMALDSLGNVYVTGFCDMRGMYSPSDFATVAYDPSGNELWVATYDGPGDNNDIAWSIETGPWDNIYITGISAGNGTGMDSVTIAYDPSGNELWVARYDGGVGNTDSSYDIAIDPYGNVYVTGVSKYGDNEHDAVTIKYGSGQIPQPTLDIDPDTLNLRSRGRWITAYIEVYDGRDIRDIDLSTLLLNETIPAERWPYAIGDYDDDGIPDLMVKFNRSDVQRYIEGLDLSPGGAGIFGYWVTLTVNGSFNDGTTLECSDTIRVLTAERMGVEPSPFSPRTYNGEVRSNADAELLDIRRARPILPLPSLS